MQMLNCRPEQYGAEDDESHAIEQLTEVFREGSQGLGIAVYEWPKVVPATNAAMNPEPPS
jgi:hypothetical protein